MCRIAFDATAKNCARCCQRGGRAAGQPQVRLVEERGSVQRFAGRTA
jgi:hypothetical protein